MKRLFLLIVLFPLAMYAQEDYKPLLKDGRTWNYVYHHFEDELKESETIYAVSYKLQGEVTIDGTTYAAMYRQKTDEAATFYAGFREEGRKVFARSSAEAPEVVVADFDYNGLYCLPEAIQDERYAQVRDDVDMIGVGGLTYRRHTYKLDGNILVYGVEGIGNSQYGITSYPDPLTPKLPCYCDYQEFTSCYQDGKCIFTAQDFCAPKSIELGDDERQLVVSNNDFAFSLFSTIRAEEDKSLVLSPLSITYALGMLNNGAEGQTQQEICQTLGFTNADAVNSFCRKMLSESGTLDEQTRSLIANTVFINGGMGYQLQDAFVEKATASYDATVQSRNFADGETMDAINQWASDHTEGMIKEVLDEQTFDPFAVSYLLNAIYFKGGWASKFDSSITRDEPFGAAAVKVPMMRQCGEFVYGEDDNCQYLMLPYGNGVYRMTVMLPREDKTMADVLGTLNGQNWQDWEKQARKLEVDVKLPRFETSISQDLVKVMQTLGVRLAFMPGVAEFPYFCNADDFYIGRMLQSARIRVDEEGTEAAAVTIIEGKATAMPPYEFHATRPFLYIISEQSTGIIFFIGQYLGEDDASGIHSPKHPTPDPGNTCYDLQGRRMTRPLSKGIYITNGRKRIK